MRYNITRQFNLLYYTLSECARICCIEDKNHLHIFLHARLFHYCCGNYCSLITVPFSAVEFVLCNLNPSATMETE